MNNEALPSNNERLSLKEPTGWFAAGQGFRKALALLSDGAFKLYVYLCLEADRRTGRIRATHKGLALALGKSKRVIGTYVAELEAEGICSVKAGKNQFDGTTFEISDDFWPYHRATNYPESPEQQAYIDAVRECFLTLGCTSGKFGAAEAATARKMQQRGIPLAVIQEAMLMGACRKYSCWFEGQALDPIRTLNYFEQLIAEIQAQPFPPGYSAYLRKKVGQFAKSWRESAKPLQTASEGGCGDMAAVEIVQ